MNKDKYRRLYEERTKVLPTDMRGRPYCVEEGDHHKVMRVGDFETQMRQWDEGKTVYPGEPPPIRHRWNYLKRKVEFEYWRTTHRNRKTIPIPGWNARETMVEIEHADGVIRSMGTGWFNHPSRRKRKPLQFVSNPYWGIGVRVLSDYKIDVYHDRVVVEHYVSRKRGFREKFTRVHPDGHWLIVWIWGFTPREKQ